MKPEFEVRDDPAGALAERLAGAGGHLVLTGGSTPRDAYSRAAELRDDWSGVTLWFSDERCVPPDDERSNFGLVKVALLDRVTGAAPEVHRVQGELGPEQGAEAYEGELRDAGPPTFDLTVLGMGGDGHVCSLFPGRPELEKRERLVVGVQEAGMEPYVSRVSLTLAAVNASREVVFLVTGESKAGVAARAFSGRQDPQLPASLVQPESGRLTVVLDPAAAAEL